MNMLVDTNVLSETVRARPNPGVLRWLAGHPSFAISAITLEELSFGIERVAGKRRALLYEWLERLRGEPPPALVPVDAEIAMAAGRLRARRERKGRPVAQADMLIAASALTQGLTLVTRNVIDFEDCGIALLNPFVSD
jgi:predicted nucleic acid-binding protein